MVPHGLWKFIRRKVKFVKIITRESQDVILCCCMPRLEKRLERSRERIEKSEGGTTLVFARGFRDMK